MHAEKRALRRKLREEYLALDETYIASADSLISQNLFSMAEYKEAQVIYTYYSTGREVDTRAIIRRALDDGKTVLLPVLCGKGIMQPRRLTTPDALKDGAYGIPVPDSDEPFYSTDSIDLILVPGLAFDHSGFRLGQGGGYYDRLLSLCGACAVGLVRDKMVLDALPIEAHDKAVDRIVTEKSIARLR